MYYMDDSQKITYSYLVLFYQEIEQMNDLFARYDVFLSNLKTTITIKDLQKGVVQDESTNKQLLDLIYNLKYVCSKVMSRFLVLSNQFQGIDFTNEELKEIQEKKNKLFNKKIPEVDLLFEYVTFFNKIIVSGIMKDALQKVSSFTERLGE